MTGPGEEWEAPGFASPHFSVIGVCDPLASRLKYEIVRLTFASEPTPGP